MPGNMYLYQNGTDAYDSYALSHRFGIAENYRKNAAILRMDYPHTAAILDELAKSYSRESIYEYKRDFLDG